MEKDFENWGVLKRELDNRVMNKDLYCQQRELWVCSTGLNIGSEENGKGPLFSRPVLVFKVVNAVTFLGIPISTKNRRDDRYFKFNLGGVDQFAILSQVRLFSVKRLQNRLAILPIELFQQLFANFETFLRKSEIPYKGDSPADTARVS